MKKILPELLPAKISYIKVHKKLFIYTCITNFITEILLFEDGSGMIKINLKFNINHFISVLGLIEFEKCNWKRFTTFPIFFIKKNRRSKSFVITDHYAVGVIRIQC